MPIVARRRATPEARWPVNAAFLDAKVVANWMVPTGMTSQVHEFEGRAGGRFRISLGKLAELVEKG